jgi:hypothetical protein
VGGFAPHAPLAGWGLMVAMGGFTLRDTLWGWGLCFRCWWGFCMLLPLQVLLFFVILVWPRVFVMMA